MAENNSSSKKSWKDGYGREVTMTDLTNLYRQTMSRSVPNSAKLFNSTETNFFIEADFKATDCNMLETVSTRKSYSLMVRGETIEQVHCASAPHFLNELMSATSDNQRFTARLKSSNSDKKNQILEIWDRSVHLRTIDVNELPTHGPINTDPHFRRLFWSPLGQQNQLLYVCQAKKQKPFQPFKKKFPIDEKKEEEKTEDISSKSAEEFIYREDWGECLDEIEHTILGLIEVPLQENNCDLKIHTIEVENFSLSDPFFICSKNVNVIKVGCVGWDENPRRIGLVYCNNRPARIFIHELNKESDIGEKKFDKIKELHTDGRSSHSPRVDNEGNKFVYLVNDTWGAHRQATELFLYNFENDENKKLRCINCMGDNRSEKRLDLIQDELFIQELPNECFASDNKHVLITTFNNLYTKLTIYNIETQFMNIIEFPSANVKLLEFKYDLIVAAGSDINTTPTLFVAKLNLLNGNNYGKQNLKFDDCVAWHQLEECHHYDDISYEAGTITVPSPYLKPDQIESLGEERSKVSYILIKPSSVKKCNFESEKAISSLEKCTIDTEKQKQTIPTIVLPHGGPHSNFIVSHMPVPILFAQLGMRTLLVNYRGATGVSQEYLRMLNGYIGKMDVEDVLNCVKYLCDKHAIDSDKLVISGGSHGGWLACHLSGTQPLETNQWTFKFKCALIRNPVVEPFSLSMTSDIPDWAFNETLGHNQYKSGWFPDGEAVKQMYERSPVSPDQSQYRIPTLMLLGTKDRRVPMFQGMRWYEMLKANGVRAKCKVYPDHHGLARADVAADTFLTSVTWIFEHL